MFDHQLYTFRPAFIYLFIYFTIEPVKLSVAKSYYNIGLLVTRSSNMLSVTKS
jgi:hypothetical protein